MVERKRRFVDAIARGSDVGEAARFAGVVRSTVYAWAGGDAMFARKWRGAELASIGELRVKAWELARGGDVRLIMWLIDRYERSDGYDGDGPAQVPAVVQIVGLEEVKDGHGPFLEFSVAPRQAALGAARGT